MPATTRVPRATLQRELRHPPARNVPRGPLKPRTTCECAHVKPPLYRTRPNKLGLSQNKKANYQNKLATN